MYCRDINNPQKSIEVLEKAQHLFETYCHQTDRESILLHYKLLRYKGDANRSIGNYDESW